jgi:hypothetical protein
VRGIHALVSGATALCALGAAGCGGGERQDANEPSGTFPLRVSAASFPASQSLSGETRMRITVENTGSRTAPDVAVTVFKKGNGTRASAFAENSKQIGLGSTSRPIWIVDSGPKGGDTAYSNTWALGPLKPHASRTFTWRVSPVRAGTFAVAYEVAAGLTGKAQARAPGGGRPRGAFRVTVSDKPAHSTVDAKGDVVNGGG